MDIGSEARAGRRASKVGEAPSAAAEPYVVERVPAEAAAAGATAGSAASGAGGSPTPARAHARARPHAPVQRVQLARETHAVEQGSRLALREQLRAQRRPPWRVGGERQHGHDIGRSGR